MLAALFILSAALVADMLRDAWREHHAHRGRPRFVEHHSRRFTGADQTEPSHQEVAS